MITKGLSQENTLRKKSKFFRKDSRIIDINNICLKDEKPSYKPKNEVLSEQDIETNYVKSLDFTNDDDCQKIITILKKVTKTNRELELLYKSFAQIPCFNQLIEKISVNHYQSLIKRLKYEKFSKGETIFQEGEFGSKYYILVKGSVYVLFHKGGINHAHENEEKHHKSHSHKLKHNSHSNNNNNSDKNDSSAQLNNSQQMKESLPTQDTLFPTNSNGLIEIQKRFSEIISDPIKIMTNPGENHQNNSHKPKAQVIPHRLDLSINNNNNNNTNNKAPFILKSNKAPLILDNLKLDQYSYQGSSSPFSGCGSPSMTKSMYTMDSIIDSKNKTTRGKFQTQITIKNCNDLLSSIEPKTQTVSPRTTKISGLDDIEEYIKEKYPDYNIAKTLESGQGFGELALLSHSRRTATIICKEECFIITLTKDAYEKTLGEYHNKLYQDKIKSLKSMAIFSDWSNSKISALLMLFEFKTIPKDTIVYNKGDKAEYFYFIGSGEVEIRKTIRIIDKPTDVNNNLNRSEIMKNTHMVNNNANRHEFKEITIAKLGPGNYFGEEEIIQNLEYRENKAVCTTTINEFFIIDKEKFLDNVKNSNTISIMKKDYYAKKEWRDRYTNCVKKKLDLGNNHLSIPNQSNSKTGSIASSPRISIDFKDKIENKPHSNELEDKALKMMTSRKVCAPDINKVSYLKGLLTESFRQPKPSQKSDNFNDFDPETIKFFPKQEKSFHHIKQRVPSSSTIKFDNMDNIIVKENAKDMTLNINDLTTNPSQLHYIPKTVGSIPISSPKSQSLMLHHLNNTTSFCKSKPKITINDSQILAECPTNDQILKQTCFALGLNKIKEREPMFNSKLKNYIGLLNNVPKKISRFNFHAFTPEHELLDEILINSKSTAPSPKEVVNIHTKKASAIMSSPKLLCEMKNSPVNPRKSLSNIFCKVNDFNNDADLNTTTSQSQSGIRPFHRKFLSFTPTSQNKTAYTTVKVYKYA